MVWHGWPHLTMSSLLSWRWKAKHREWECVHHALWTWVRLARQAQRVGQVATATLVLTAKATVRPSPSSNGQHATKGLHTAKSGV